MENDDPVLPPEIITGLQEMLRSGVRPEVIADSLGSVIDTLHGLQVPRTLALGLVKLLCRGADPVTWHETTVTISGEKRHVSC